MSKTSQILQATLLVALIVAGVWFYYNMNGRRVVLVQPPKKETALDADAYVVPKKLHPQDLKDAKELMLQPVWVREGYRYFYMAYGPPVDTRHAAGMLGPIERLEIKDVIVQGAPGVAGRQVMAVFEKDGKRYAFSIGDADNGTYHIYSDEMLFIQDPHDLYKHWPADVWEAIDQHQVKAGMSELQASFAIGVGIPEGLGTTNPRIVNYPNGGHSVKVTYENGKATEVKTSQ